MSEKTTSRPASAGATARRGANTGAGGRRGGTSAAQMRAATAGADNQFFSNWGLLSAAFVTITLIFYLFTPYTHQLDEIKNVFLMTIPPFLFAWAVWKTDFSTMSWRTHAPTFFLGIYTLVMVISYLLNPYKPIAERVVWFQMGTATFTMIFAWFMSTEDKLRKTMMFFTLLALGSTVIGLTFVAGQGVTNEIYEWMKGSTYWRQPERAPWVTLFYTLKENREEMYSTVLNSDFYAAFLVMTLPIPLSMFFVERDLMHKAVALATFLLMNVCLFLTNSNDSFMSVALLTYPIYLILGFKYVKGWNLSRRFIITFLAGSAVLLGTVAVLMLPKLARTWDFKTEAISGREILWGGGFWPWLYFDDPTRSAINIKSFLFGTGPGGYRFYFPVFRDPTFFDNQINNVTTFGHNLYLDILMEIGLLGLLAFLAFYGVILWNAFQQIRRTESPLVRFYQIALVSGLTGIALQNFFSPNYRWAVAGTIYWALFGVSMGIFHIENPGVAAGTRQRRDSIWKDWPRLGKSAAAVLAFLFVVRSVPQGLNYWEAAVANGMGLRYLDYAESTSTESRKNTYLAQAAEEFKRAIRENPTFVTSYYKLAHVYNQLGNVEEAVKTYEALNAMNPNYSEIHQNLAIMYWIQARELEGEARLARLEDSYREVKEAARQSLKPNVQWLAGTTGEELAAYYLAAGNEQKATDVYNEIKQYYRNIIDYTPRLEEYKAERQKYYTRAHTRLVALAEYTQKPDEGIKVLQDLVRDNPDTPDYLKRLLAMYDKHGKVEEKMEFLQTAVHNDPLNVELRRTLAQALAQAGKEEAYRKELRRIEVLAPGDAAALNALYASYSKGGESARVEEYRNKLTAAGVPPADAMTTPAAASATGTTATTVTTAPQAASTTGTTAPAGQ